MDRTQHRRRPANRFRPQAEAVEGRLLLTLGGIATGALGPGGFLSNPPGFHVVRPNTPVLPFAATLATATFVDPAATVTHGDHVVVGTQSYVGPYAYLNAATGFIKIGSKSVVQANATVVSNPAGVPSASGYPANVEIGDQVSVGFGATVVGPSVIGAYYTAAKPTGIGPNALIDGATVEAGAVVGALARVGPGVTVPAGVYVLPGANVTSDAEASDPALGKVVKLPAAVSTALASTLARSSALAAGFTNLYQGNSATGSSPGSTTSGVNNGNLTAVEGASPEPGNTTSTAATGIAFETSAQTLPSFVGPIKPAVMYNLFNLRARVIGNVQFSARAAEVAHRLGHRDVILGDEGQPITFAAAPRLGDSVTIGSPGGGITTTTTTTTTYGVTSTKTTTTSTGVVNFGRGFAAGPNAVVLGGGGAAKYAFGANVTVGPGAVVSGSSVGAGASIGSRAYVSNTTVAPGTSIPAGAIVVDGTYRGQVQW